MYTNVAPTTYPVAYWYSPLGTRLMVARFPVFVDIPRGREAWRRRSRADQVGVWFCLTDTLPSVP